MTPPLGTCHWPKAHGSADLSPSALQTIHSAAHPSAILAVPSWQCIHISHQNNAVSAHLFRAPSPLVSFQAPLFLCHSIAQLRSNFPEPGHTQASPTPHNPCAVFQFPPPNHWLTSSSVTISDPSLRSFYFLFPMVSLSHTETSVRGVIETRCSQTKCSANPLLPFLSSGDLRRLSNQHSHQPYTSENSYTLLGP